MADATHNDEIIRTVSSLPPGELAAFLAVAEYGGFRAASRTLGQTPSAVNGGVKTGHSPEQKSATVAAA
ncbi:helix-turn-helix domain-containing protein [Shinella curvata]|uniref:helix-turn-helix domain-containing protein n=1 Tax=Shinella curvata TaxID=1817964 RepID=UPI00349EE33D